METTELTSSRYWESADVDLRLNPRRKIDSEGLVSYLEQQRGIRSAVVLATSGSTGAFKFVVLSREALLHSARAVIEHCGLGSGDVSLAGLSGFHVGGLGIYARACLTGSRVVEMDTGTWQRDGARMIRAIEENEVTLTSMTPTHLHDLVTHGVRAPGSLRLVFLGGGRMDPRLIRNARELGWPVRVSYGMTEAGSQVATARDDSVEWLPILKSWETRVEDDGRLAIRGKALFSGYVQREGDGWSFDGGRNEDGWYVTGDRCDLEGERLRFRGRADDLVKISGEFVSVAEVNALASSIANELGSDAAVVAVSDDRRGQELVLVLEACDRDADEFLGDLNRELDGIEAVRRVVLVEELPRTEIGKLDRVELDRIAAAAGSGGR